MTLRWVGHGVSHAWSHQLIGWKGQVAVPGAEHGLTSETRILLVPIGEPRRVIEASLVLEERVQLAPLWVGPAVRRRHPPGEEVGRPGGAIAPLARVLGWAEVRAPC